MPKEWRGRFFEDFDGDVFRSRLGRTITETDNTWFTNLTLNTNQVHFNAPTPRDALRADPRQQPAHALARRRPHRAGHERERRANLGWTDIRLPKLLRRGHAVGGERDPEPVPRVAADRGIVDALPRVNQRGRSIEYLRTFMVLRRGAPEARSSFPTTDTPWGWAPCTPRRRSSARSSRWCASSSTGRSSRRPRPSTTTTSSPGRSSSGCASSACSITIPEEHGGLGLDVTTYAPVQVELARLDVALGRPQHAPDHRADDRDARHRRAACAPAPAHGHRRRAAYSMTEPHAAPTSRRSGRPHAARATTG